MRPIQLPLGIRLDDSATFENFVSGENGSLLSLLQQNREPFLYMWGSAGTGKTHLLQATCHQAVQVGKSIMYLPLRAEETLLPDILDGLEAAALICIDDIHAVAGQPHWEHALFHFYNRVRETGNHLYVTASVSPTGLPIQLADLQSRLAWGLTYQLQPLRDEQKIIALQQRARGRGMELSTEVARFMLKQLPRDMHSLFAMLDRLDQASLREQRLLTIPFVKQWLDG